MNFEEKNCITQIPNVSCQDTKVAQELLNCNFKKGTMDPVTQDQVYTAPYARLSYVDPPREINIEEPLKFHNLSDILFTVSQAGMHMYIFT